MTPAQNDWKEGTEEDEKQRKTREFHEHFRNQYEAESYNPQKGG